MDKTCNCMWYRFRSNIGGRCGKPAKYRKYKFGSKKHGEYWCDSCWTIFKGKK